MFRGCFLPFAGCKLPMSSPISMKGILKKIKKGRSEGMDKGIMEGVIDQLQYLTNGMFWVFSVIFSTILAQIGYPKDSIIFIVVLVCIDLVSKQYAIVRQNYNDFSIRLYGKAWMEKKLTSRQMKNGLGVKSLLYLPILYMANQAGCIQDFIFGDTVAQVMYTMLILVEMASVFENFRDAGHIEVNPLLKLINNKQEELEKNM